MGAMGVVLLMLLGVFAIPGGVSAAPVSLSGKLTTATGTTTDLGGGNYFYVKFGADAAFGIVWGNDQTANNIYFVAIKARYLGMAQVYDNSGALVEANRSIKIFTIYAVKLDDILEFSDSSGDGVLQGHRVYDSTGNFTGQYTHNEQLFKKVDLRTSWEQSPVQASETSDSRLWTFSLTAKDLSYAPLDNYSGSSGDNKLNNLTLTFHLYANMVQVDNATIPQWRIEVQRSGMGMGTGMMFSRAVPMADMVVSGKMIKYHVKWDQSIQGWDFDASDSHPTLLMELGAIVGNYVPPALALAWMMSTVQHINEPYSCEAPTSTGSLDVDSRTGMMQAPRPLTSPMLTFGGDRTRIGALEWVSNVTVDGTTMQLHSQIMGGVPFWTMGMNGALFGGFAILAGISFPGGELIVHDPTFTSDALVDVGSRGTELGFPVFLLGAIALLAVMVIVVVAVLIGMEKKPGQKQQQQQNYERTMSSQPGAWAKYYQKK